MRYTPKPPVYQPPLEYLVTPRSADAYRYFGACPRSQSLLAYSLTHQAQILYILPCRTWSCRPCAEHKIKTLAVQTTLAHPNRLLTLTVNPALYSSKTEAWERTRKQVPILIRRLRERFGEIEYLRVTEVTKKGWPHYHLLVRSGFLPQPVVKKIWNELTGAWIVDLRQVKKSFSAYKYLVKYLSKMHHLKWTDRHVSMSRGFRVDRNSRPVSQIETAEADFIQQHPANLVTERFRGSTLKRLSPNSYLLLPDLSSNAPAEPSWKVPQVRPGPHFPRD